MDTVLLLIGLTSLFAATVNGALGYGYSSITVPIALLMVSNIPYPHVTGKVFAGKKHIGHLIQLLLAVLIISMVRELAPVLIFWVYAFVFPLRVLVARNLRPEPAGPPAANLDEPMQR